jgi:hypothetical protein
MPKVFRIGYLIDGEVKRMLVAHVRKTRIHGAKATVFQRVAEDGKPIAPEFISVDDDLVEREPVRLPRKVSR